MCQRVDARRYDDGDIMPDDLIRLHNRRVQRATAWRADAIGRITVNQVVLVIDRKRHE